MAGPKLLEAKPFMDNLKKKLREEVVWLRKEHKITPSIATILVNTEDILIFPRDLYLVCSPVW